MSETPPIPPGLDDGDAPERDLAGEYVLGVLDAGERDAARRRAEADAAFAAAVSAWEARLVPLVELVPAVEPPAGLWPRILAALPPTAANSNTALRLWQGLTAASVALAAACLVLLALPRAPPPAPLVAVLSPQGGPVAAVATLDVAHRRLLLTAANMPRPAGRSPELWIMPPGVKPVSLGLVGAGSTTELPLTPAELTGIRAGTPMAVSMEPLGGSPSGLPTGPVVALGEIRAL